MAYISYLSVYGYSSGLSGSTLTIKDDETKSQTQFELNEEELVTLNNFLWDVIDRRKHKVAEQVRYMQRPLLVDHSDGKTIAGGLVGEDKDSEVIF